MAQAWAVGRVHPTDALPRLRKAVLSGRVEMGAFGVVGDRGHVGREMKLCVQLGKQGRRGFPFVGLMPELHRLALAFSLPVSGLPFGIGTVNRGAAQGSE